MGSIKNAFKFIFSPTASRTTGILVILIIAAAVPLTVFVAQKQQELRQRAQSTQQVSVPTQDCMPPFNVFVGKYCSADLALQNAQNNPDNFKLEVVESSNAILSEDLTLCNNGKDPVYYVYEKGKQGNACVATDPESGLSLNNGTCNNQGSCVGTITVASEPTATPIPTAAPPAAGQTDTCTGNPGYQCSSTSPNPSTCNPAPYPQYQCGSTPGFCWYCPTTSPANTAPIPTSTPIPPTATTAPVAPPAGQQTVPPPTSPSNCPLKSKGDANCDGKVNIVDYNILRDEFTHKLQTKTADFNNNNVIDDLDLSIWKNSMQDSNIRHY